MKKLLKITLQLLLALAVPYSAVLAELPVKNISIAKSGLEDQYSNGKFPMNFKVTNNCMFGDFDAIKQDMLYSESKKLLVSLESLATGEEAVTEVLGKLSQPVTIKKEDKLGDVMTDFDTYFKVLSNYGEDFTLEYKSPSEPELYLLKVCKDSTGKNSCKDKPYVTVLEIVEQYKNPGRSFKPEDRVYYTQLVSIDSDNITVLADSVSQENVAAITANFTEKNVAGASTLGNQLVGVAKVRSLPLNIYNNKLQITLPSFDPVKCGQQQK